MHSQTDLKNPRQSVSRRDFIRRIGSGLLAGAFIPLGSRGGLWQGKPDGSSPADWDKDTFAPLVGHSFTVNLGSAGGLQTYKLLSVQDGSAKILTKARKLIEAPAGKCYVLIFQSTQRRALRQKTFEFDHSRLGKFPLFVVPGSLEKDGQRYVAVINHVRA